MSCKKYIAAILLWFRAAGRLLWFFRAGNGRMGSGIPGIWRKQHGGAGRTGCARTLARQLAAVQSAHPLTEEFFSWCAQEAPSGLLEGIDDRLEAEALYSERWVL